MKRGLSFLIVLALLIAMLPVSTLAAAGFTDVDAGAFYATPVRWAVEQGITNGRSATEFAPDAPCKRSEVVTFLWRAVGKPAHSLSSVPFTDIELGEFYHDALLWAVESEITNGMTATEFWPNAICERRQVVTFLWRLMGQPEPVGERCTFTDVTTDMYCYDAIVWAVENGITNGMPDGSFGIEASCTRGQIVTFLYRLFNPDWQEDVPGSDYAQTDDSLDYPSVPSNPGTIPAIGDAVTQENALALLDRYDPDGAFLLRATMKQGNDFMVWFSPQGTTADGIGIAVHEQCHIYSANNGGLFYDSQLSDFVQTTAYYIGEGQYITLTRKEIFPSEEMSAHIPEALRTFRYDDYVGAGSDLDSNVNGIYGLLNEFNAYSWGSHVNVSLYDYFLTQPLTADNLLRYVRISSSDYYAYSEFKYYILSYMLYAEAHYPQIYAQLMADQALLDLFRITEARYAGVVERYFENLDALEALCAKNGLSTRHEDGYFLINGNGYGTGEETYSQLEKAMQAPEFVRMYQLMTG